MKETKRTRSWARYGGILAIALLGVAGTVAACDCGPGVRTPGYWVNHPEAWLDSGGQPIDSIVIGGVTYSQEDAIDLMKAPVKGDKRLTLFPSLVAALLNVYAGNCGECIQRTLNEANLWFSVFGGDLTNPDEAIPANSYAWQHWGDRFNQILDEYNNGVRCAPAAD